MNRIIEFRALKDDMSNCNFVYGQLVYDAIDNPRITHKDKSGEGLTFHSCLKGTEGQFTGLTDKNGTKIFEGDIIKVANNVVYVVQYIPRNDDDELYSTFAMNCQSRSTLIAFDSYAIDKIEIIGNIHEHSHLLNS